jgi:phage baseplate assembly protein V
MTTIERLYIRLLMVFGRALVKVVNDAGGLQQLQIQLGKDELRDNTPRFAEYGFTSSPLSGARAIAIFMGGDRSNGAVIATDDPRYRPTGLKSGEAVVYDHLGRKIYLTQDGIVIDGAGAAIKFMNCPTLSTDGDFTAKGEITAEAGTANSVSLTGHDTSNVQPGAGTSGPPVPGT